MENVLALLAMKFHVLIRAIYSFPLNYQVLYFRPKCYRLLFFRERAATCYAELHTQSSTPCDIGKKLEHLQTFQHTERLGFVYNTIAVLEELTRSNDINYLFTEMCYCVMKFSACITARNTFVLCTPIDFVVVEETYAHTELENENGIELLTLFHIFGYMP